MRGITRRSFLYLSFSSLGIFFLPSCRKKHPLSNNPEEILQELRAHPVINKLKAGEIVFLHKSIEGLSPKGKEALACIQQALIVLELLPPISEREYGIYGDKTAKAIFQLQNWAKIDQIEGWEGRKIEVKTIKALERALEEKLHNRWAPPGNFVL